jgi:hypothetical protein
MWPGWFTVLARCHRFLVIPTRHCTNLSAAVYTVLYDRHAKRVHAGLEPRNAPSSGSSDHNGPSDSSEPLTGFDEPDSMAPATGLTWSR